MGASTDTLSVCPGVLSPFAESMQTLYIELPWECLDHHSGYPFRVYNNSLVPIGLFALIWLVYAWRMLMLKGVDEAVSDVRRVSNLTGMTRSGKAISRSDRIFSQHCAATLFVLYAYAIPVAW